MKTDELMLERLAHMLTYPEENYHKLSVSAIKNGRRKMEDRHVVITNLNALCNIPVRIIFPSLYIWCAFQYLLISSSGFHCFQRPPSYSYYAVFDGHAGANAAVYAASHLHFNIIHHPLFERDIETAIEDAFRITDEKYIERSKRDVSENSIYYFYFLFCSWMQWNSYAIIIFIS